MKWIKEQKQDRQIEKARKFSENAAFGFWELYYLALTFHGRRSINQVIQAAEEGKVEVNPQLLDLYRLVMTIAPYHIASMLN